MITIEVDGFRDYPRVALETGGELLSVESIAGTGKTLLNAIYNARVTFYEPPGDFPHTLPVEFVSELPEASQQALAKIVGQHVRPCIREDYLLELWKGGSNV